MEIFYQLGQEKETEKGFLGEIEIYSNINEHEPGWVPPDKDEYLIRVRGILYSFFMKCKNIPFTAKVEANSPSSSGYSNWLYVAVSTETKEQWNLFLEQFKIFSKDVEGYIK